MLGDAIASKKITGETPKNSGKTPEARSNPNDPRDKQRKTETDRDRQRQTETDRDRPDRPDRPDQTDQTDQTERQTNSQRRLVVEAKTSESMTLAEFMKKTSAKNITRHKGS